MQVNHITIYVWFVSLYVCVPGLHPVLFNFYSYQTHTGQRRVALRILRIPGTYPHLENGVWPPARIIIDIIPGYV